MKNLSIYVFFGLSLFFMLGCASNSSNLESENLPLVESTTETTVDIESTESLTVVNDVLPFEESEILFEENIVEPEEEIITLTTLEIYQQYIDSCTLEIESSPNQITKNKKFSKSFSVKCTKDGNPMQNILVTVNYPVAQTNGVITFGEQIIETDENGIASFLPSDTSFSCNSHVYFYLTPEIEDEETLKYAKEKAISIPYKVITDRFYNAGILALIDYNASNRPLSTNTTATSLQPPLRKAGFQTIGNAPFDANIVTSKNLYNEAKNIFGSTVSFMIYGTVKFAEPVEQLENGEYIVTFVTNFSVMNIRDGKIIYTEEFLTTETGASEWEATNKLRTKTIPEIITQKVIYGI